MAELVQLDRRILLVMPKWGGARGGIYTMTNNLIRKLGQYGIPVSMVCGTRKCDLPDYDKDFIKTQEIEYLEPGDDVDGESGTPEDNIKRTDLFEHVLQEMQKYVVVVFFSYDTVHLAKHLLHNARVCEYLVVNCEPASAAIVSRYTADASANAVFSLGKRALRSLNTTMHAAQQGSQADSPNSLFVPDVRGLFQPASISSIADVESRVFVPWDGIMNNSFPETCIKIVEKCNEQLQLLSKQKINVTVQNPTQNEQFVSRAAEYMESLGDAEYAARSSSLIICSGNMNEAGFSGLEFLMNGFLTFVVDESDVAEILKDVDGSLAKMCLLRPINQKSSDHSDVWVKEIIKAIDNLDYKKSLLSCQKELMKKVYGHPNFTIGHERFLKILSSHWKPTKQFVATQGGKTTLPAISEALAQPMNAYCKFEANLLEMGEIHKSTNGKPMFDILLADRTTYCMAKVFNLSERKNLRLGKTYNIMDIKRKIGHCAFWVVPGTILASKKANKVPPMIEDQAKLAFNSMTGEEENVKRSLSDALMTSASSIVSGKITALSQFKVTKEGPQQLYRFVALRDDPSDRAVKIALFGEAATKTYEVGDRLEITDVYIYHNETDPEKPPSLTTKKTSTVNKILSLDDFEDINPDAENGLEDPDFKDQSRQYYGVFVITGVVSVDLYDCCTKKSCRKKKFNDGVCPTCFDVDSTKDFCGVFTVTMPKTDQWKKVTVFASDLAKLVQIKPPAEFKDNDEVIEALEEELDIEGNGLVTGNILQAIESLKHKIPIVGETPSKHRKL